MARLVLVNGAPGSGKSTGVELQARDHPLALPVDVDALRARLAERGRDPKRPEHEVNNRFVGPSDAQRLVESMDRLANEALDGVA